MHISLDEIKAVYHEMISKKQRLVKVPIAYKEHADYFKDATNNSILPVGSDGIKTCHVDKIPHFFTEIERILNQSDAITGAPRINFKRFKVVEKITDKGKSRKIVKACLRDQIVLRILLERLTSLNIVSGDYLPNKNVLSVIKDIKTEFSTRNDDFTIIRTDIQNFYPSVNVEILLEHFYTRYGNSKEGLMYYELIKKALYNKKSDEEFTGLPIGLSISGILGEYYLSIINIHAFAEGVKLYRYADDCFFILDKGIDPENFKNELIDRLSRFNLSISNEKTMRLTKNESFKFLGVEFNNQLLNIGEEKMNLYKKKIQSDIDREIKAYKILKILKPESTIPSFKSIAAVVKKEHKNGIRSKTAKRQAILSKLNQLT